MQQAITDGTRGLSLLVGLHWDRLLPPLTVALALGAGAWLGTAGLQAMIPPPPPGF